MFILQSGKRFRGVITGDWYQTRIGCIVEPASMVCPGVAGVCSFVMTGGNILNEKTGETHTITRNEPWLVADVEGLQ